MGQKKTIYAIYTAKEKVKMFHFLNHLKSEKVDDDAILWYDTAIKSGEQWKPTDESRLENTDVFVLLISNAFMYSEFIKQLEFKKIIDRYKAGKSKVVPILLENCPWDIAFEADTYTFSFKELTVLPENKKTVIDFDSTDEAYQKCASYIKQMVTSLTEPNDPKPFKTSFESTTKLEDTEDQLALTFSGDTEAEGAESTEHDLDDSTVAEESVSPTEDELMASEQQRLQELAESRKKAEEELRQRTEMEAQRREEEEQWLHERMEENLELQMAPRYEPMESPETEDEELVTGLPTLSRKKLILGISVAALVALMIMLFSPDTDETPEDLIDQSTEEMIVDSDTESVGTTKNATSSTLGAGSALSIFAVGAGNENGIIFLLKDNGDKAVTSHMKDYGPMTWKKAMDIQEQLGDGWRLPTLEELKVMYKTIGPGAENAGKFTDGLYWSSTPYDANQARLIRFSDGNTTFHYNSKGNFRKFLVRAVRDIER